MQTEDLFFCFLPIFSDISVARISQWGVENDVTFDHTLYTGADPESFGGVHVILNYVKC